MAKIEEVKTLVSPVVTAATEGTAKGNRIRKRLVKKDLQRLIAEARQVVFVDARIDHKAVDAKDLYIIAVHSLDTSLIEIFVKLTKQFIAMALGIYDKRIPAPWAAQAGLSGIIKLGG